MFRFYCKFQGQVFSELGTTYPSNLQQNLIFTNNYLVQKVVRPRSGEEPYHYNVTEPLILSSFYVASGA